MLQILFLLTSNLIKLAGQSDPEAEIQSYVSVKMKAEIQNSVSMRTETDRFMYAYLLKFVASSSVKNVIALPGLPALPVLPRIEKTKEI